MNPDSSLFYLSVTPMMLNLHVEPTWCTYMGNLHTVNFHAVNVNFCNLRYRDYMELEYQAHYLPRLGS